MGEVDAITGLLTLREGAAFNLYAHARVLAQTTLRQKTLTQSISRLNFMAERVLNRSFTRDEQVILIASLINLTKEYEAAPGEAVKLISTAFLSLSSSSLFPLKFSIFQLMILKLLDVKVTNYMNL